MRTYPDRPWIGIGVVVHKDENILLIKRGKEPNKGRWSLPGGAQNIGETVFEGAAREVLEETAVSTTGHRLIDVVDSIHRDHKNAVKYHYTLIEIACEYEKGQLQALDDAACAQWVPFEKIEDYDLMAETIRIIKASYLSRKASFTEE